MVDGTGRLRPGARGPVGLGQRRPSRRLSMDRARCVSTQLAGLHAWSTDPANAAVLEAFPSIDTPIARDLLVPAFAPGWQIYLEKVAVPVPAAVARFAERFAELAAQALEALTERSMLLHGDIRADNMFFDGDRLKVVDFQFAARGRRRRRHRLPGQPGAADRGAPRSRRGAGPRVPRSCLSATVSPITRSTRRGGIIDSPWPT